MDLNQDRWAIYNEAPRIHGKIGACCMFDSGFVKNKNHNCVGNTVDFASPNVYLSQVFL